MVSIRLALLANLLVYTDEEFIQTIKSTSKPLLFFIAEGKEPIYEALNKVVKLNTVVIPGAGHTAFVDKPDEFNKILDEFMRKYTAVRS